MGNKSRKIARATIIAMMVGVAPFGSAIGQETGDAAAPGVPPQQLIHQAANRQTVGRPASMAEAPVQPPLAAPAPAPAPAQDPASIITAAAVQEVEATRLRIEAEAKEARELEEKAAALKPGKFIWNPDRSPSGEVEVVVSIEEQKAYVFRADKLIGVTTVSTGKRGHRTPTGSFTILQKNRRHFSNLYNNAPMPNMQRLTWGGIALHAGALPGYPASHGCVRLPMEFSKVLFGVTKMGGRVHIVAGAPAAAADALAYATGRRGAIQVASAQ
jgi:lipoprotein-anchoring transpeptidase ErfK/SrfK